MIAPTVLTSTEIQSSSMLFFSGSISFLIRYHRVPTRPAAIAIRVQPTLPTRIRSLRRSARRRARRGCTRRTSPGPACSVVPSLPPRTEAGAGSAARLPPASRPPAPDAAKRDRDRGLSSSATEFSTAIDTAGPATAAVEERWYQHQRLQLAQLWRQQNCSSRSGAHGDGTDGRTERENRRPEREQFLRVVLRGERHRGRPRDDGGQIRQLSVRVA